MNTQMPNLYFSVCGFFVALLLVILYFSKQQAKNLETKVYSFMLVTSLIDTIISTAIMYIAYLNYEQNIQTIIILNKLDFLQYLAWASLLLFYIMEISFGTKKVFRKIRHRLTKFFITVGAIVYSIIVVLPVDLHNEDGVMYAYGASVNLLYAFCGVCFLMIILSIILNFKKVLSRKYVPVYVLLVLGAIILIVRSINPGLLIIPAALAYINLIMFFTIENPDAKMLKVATAAKNAAEKADRIKSDFLSLASHQLRTPLTSIRGYSSMLMEGDFDDLSKKQAKAINEISISSGRMSYLIDDLLNVSRLQSGRFIVNKVRTNLGKLVLEEIEQAMMMADSHKIKIEYDSSDWDKLPEVDLDQGKIGEVISNMIDNAIFYSKPGSSIAITLVQNGNGLEFRVKDSGIGVPKEEQGDLFTKFYRATNARTKRPDGTGIGLFLAKKIITGHGGDVIFESAEGAGSTFGFRVGV